MLNRVFLSFWIFLISLLPASAQHFSSLDSIPLLIPLRETISNKHIDQLLDRARALPPNLNDSLLIYGATGVQHSLKNRYELGEVKSLQLLVKGYYVKGEFASSFNVALNAFNVSKRIRYEYGQSAALNGIGLVYLAQRDWDQALVEFQLALKIADKTDDRRLQAIINFNIGLVYDEKRKSGPAVKYLSKALSIGRISENKEIIAMALNRLGETYYHDNKYSDAIKAYRQGVSNTSYQSDWENSFAYSGIAQSQLELGDIDGAIGNAKKGLGHGRIVKAKWDIERSLKVLYSAYSAKGDCKNAFDYLKLNKLYADSLYSEAKESELNALHLKQKENYALYNEHAYNLTQLKMSNRVAVVIAVLALLLLVSKILIYYFFRQKSRLNRTLILHSLDISRQNKLIRKQKSELEQLNRTKDQLFAIIGHDLRAPFASIMQALDIMKSGDLAEDEGTEFIVRFKRA
jgi:predicted negative regulator of RcsB-dependent stress response